MALCTAARKPLRLASDGQRVVARLPGQPVEQLLAVGDVGHRAHHGGASAPSESPRGRELTDSHWSLPCSSFTPMTTLVVASCRPRATDGRERLGGERHPSLAWPAAAREDLVAVAGVEPGARDPRGRVVGGGHRALAVDHDHTLFEGGHRGGVAHVRSRPSPSPPPRRACALETSRQDDLEGRLAAPAGAGAGHLDGQLAPSSRTIMASKPFTTSPGSFSCARRAIVLVEVVGADERGDRSPDGGLERLHRPHAQTGGVGVDDEPVLVHDDGVGGVLDQEREPFARRRR